MRWKIHLKPTLDCNLSCYYCIERRDTERMTLGTAQRILELVHEGLPDVEEVEFEWSGGEPLLLGARFYEDVFARERRLFDGASRNTIYTNLLLATPEVLDVCEQGSVTIYTSLDSRRANSHRLAAGNYFKTLDARLSAVVRRGIPVKLYMTVTAANVDEIVDVYHYCRDMGVDFDFANVQAPYAQALPKLTQLLPDPTRFSAQAIHVFEEWYGDKEQACIVKPLYSVLEFLVRGTRPRPCVLLSFDANGTLYLCPFDISRRRARADLATISPEDVREWATLPCTVPAMGSLAECGACAFEHFCNLIHCKETASGTDASGVSVYRLTCAYWRPVFVHVQQRVKESLACIA